MSYVKCTCCDTIIPDMCLVWDGEEDTDFCPECGEAYCFEDVSVDHLSAQEIEEIDNAYPSLHEDEESDWLKYYL